MTTAKDNPQPKPKKSGFWKKLGQSIGNAIGQAFANRGQS